LRLRRRNAASVQDDKRESSWRGRSAQDDKKGWSSLARSLLFRSFAWCRLATRRLSLDDANRAVGIGENLVRDSPDVGLGDLVHAIEIAEQLAPIAVARLVGRKLLRQTLVTGEPAKQGGLGARRKHPQIFGGNILGLQLDELLVHRFLQLFVGVVGEGNAIECEQVAVFDSRPAGKTSREGSNLFVAHHRP